eukprot:389241_1
MNRYKKLKFVGEGSFARVYKVLDKKSQQIMALKCIKKDGKSEIEIDKLMEEIMILQSLSHKNIIKIMEWFVTESEICVVTEFAEKGELFKIIKKKKTKQISEMEIKVIAKQLVCALQFLHESRVIHRDIKPQNILLSADNTIKLCDFGFARALSEESTMATSIKGTPLYMAPELVQEKPYNHTVDLWSLGVILYELFYGKPPFYTNSIYKLVRMIVKDHIKYPPHPVISKQFEHFINGLLQKNPQKRFNIVHLHKHVFLQHTTAKKKKKKTTYSEMHYKKRIKCSEEKEEEEEAIENAEPQQQLNVRQKVLDILDSNDWDMIDKILIVLPQRWQSFCSLSNDDRFELKLFEKLYDLLSATQNVSLLGNIIHVMCLIMQRIEDPSPNTIRNIYRRYVCRKYMDYRALFPILCRFIKVTMKYVDVSISQLLIANVIKYDDTEVMNDVMDIVCSMMEYRHFALKLKAFSATSISKIPFVAFWGDIESAIHSLDAFFGTILMGTHHANTFKCVLYLVMTSSSIRHHLSLHTQSLISYVGDDISLDALRLFYYLNCIELDTLQLKRSASSNVLFVSNISRALLIRSSSVDSKPILQNIVTFITAKSEEEVNQIAFEAHDKMTIFDCWCHCLCNFQIDENMKLSMTIALQWLNILSKRVEHVVNTPKHEQMLIVSAFSLKTFLTFLHQILQRLLTQNNKLIGEFLSPQHIQTFCILGNPQFVLQYMSLVPFHLDTLYTDLIECCNICYSCLLYMYRHLASEYSTTTPHGIYNFHKITLEFQLISSILNYIQIAPPPQKEEACNLLFYITWKQSLFMKEFLTLNGLLIVTNCIIKQRKYHSNNIIIQVLQIISCTARKYKSFYNKIESTGIFELIPKYLLNDNESLQIKEKICNLIGNLCKHSDRFLDVIRDHNLLQILCECTENTLSSNIRRFACYAIGNIAYQSTNTNHELIICIKPLSLRLCDKDYKTQENAAGAIGNLVSSQNQSDAIIMNQIIKHNVIKLLLDEIASNTHLCVVRNCLYSLSNLCYSSKCRRSIIKVVGNQWRLILKSCLLKYGHKDPFVKKCTFKILRKMAHETGISF